jgi:hypothetical protein
MYPQSQNRRLFPIIVGVYGALWAVFSLLMLFFGLTNISGRGMEGLAAQVAIIVFGIPSLIFAVLLLVWCRRSLARRSAGAGHGAGFWLS